MWSCEFSGASKEYSWCPEDPADQDDEDAADPSVKPRHRPPAAAHVRGADAQRLCGRGERLQVETDVYNNTKV